MGGNDELDENLVTVEGYVVERELPRLGSEGEGAGRRWLGRPVGSDHLVELRRIALRDENGYGEARRLADIHAQIAHPGLLRLISVVPTEDSLVLVSEHAPGGTLADLLARRSVLDPGEVATIIAEIAPVLISAHARGVVHGWLTPDSLRFDEDDRPVVADVGLRALVADDPGVPADDVLGLAAAAYLALSDRVVRPGERHYPLYQVAPGVPSGLALAIESGLQASADDRPQMATFAGQVTAAAPRTPVRIPEPEPEEEPPPIPLPPPVSPPDGPVRPEPRQAARPPQGPSGAASDGPASQSVGAGVRPPTDAGPPHSTPPTTHQQATPPTGSTKTPPRSASGASTSARRSPVIWVGGAVVVLAVVGLIVALLLPDPPGEPGDDTTPRAAAPTTAVSSAPPSKAPMTAEEQRFRSLIQTFDNRRMRAYGNLDAKALEGVDAPSSPALAADRRRIQAFRKAGYAHVWRVRLTVRGVKIVQRARGRVVLEAVVIPWQYVLEDGDGKRTSGPKRPVTTLRITLTQVDGTGPWRWYDTAPATAALPSVEPAPENTTPGENP